MRYSCPAFCAAAWRSPLCPVLMRVALVSASLFPFASLGAQTTAQSGRSTSPVIGEWKGETVAAGSLADITLNLYPNGTYARRVMSVTEFGWTLDGGVLLLAPVMGIVNGETTFGKTSAIGVTLAGDSLIATLGKQSLVIRRVTSLVPDMPLLGRWEGLTDLNEAITQDFTADGRLIISVTLSREAGHYSIDRESINWAEQIPVPARRRSKYKLENGKLIIYISPRLPPMELRKVELTLPSEPLGPRP